jgi:hypothetical protein
MGEEGNANYADFVILARKQIADGGKCRNNGWLVLDRLVTKRSFPSGNISNSPFHRALLVSQVRSLVNPSFLLVTYLGKNIPLLAATVTP